MDPKHLAGALVAGAIVPVATAAPVLDNPSLAGAKSSNAAPTSWDVAQGTPDVVDIDGPYNSTGMPWTPSSDGGTFARLLGVNGAAAEAISQDVSGFTPGFAYRIDFEQTNLGWRNGPQDIWFDQAGCIEFLVNGKVVAVSDIAEAPESSDDPIVWEAGFVWFIAPVENLTLGIRGATADAESGRTAYMAIDGLTLIEVPAPGAAMLAAMAGVAGIRRRR